MKHKLGHKISFISEIVLKLNYNGYRFTPTQKDAVFNPVMAMYFLQRMDISGTVPDIKSLDPNLRLSDQLVMFLAKHPLANGIVAQLFGPDPVPLEGGICDSLRISDLVTITHDARFITSLMFYLGIITYAAAPTTPTSSTSAVTPALLTTTAAPAPFATTAAPAPFATTTAPMTTPPASIPLTTTPLAAPLATTPLTTTLVALNTSSASSLPIATANPTSTSTTTATPTTPTIILPNKEIRDDFIPCFQRFLSIEQASIQDLRRAVAALWVKDMQPLTEFISSHYLSKLHGNDVIHSDESSLKAAFMMAIILANEGSDVQSEVPTPHSWADMTYTEANDSHPIGKVYNSSYSPITSHTNSSWHCRGSAFFLYIEQSNHF